MSQLEGWFERKFDFAFPVDQHPNLCVRLRGTPARLEEMLRGVSKEHRVRKGGGKWSAQEHAGHLLDLEPLWRSRVEDFVGGGDVLSAADLSNRKTHEANHDDRELAELLAEFRAARLRLVDRVGKVTEDLLSRVLLHPRLKQKMRLVDHLYFVAEHDDHHLAAI